MFPKALSIFNRRVGTNDVTALSVGTPPPAAATSQVLRRTRAGAPGALGQARRGVRPHREPGGGRYENLLPLEMAEDSGVSEFPPYGVCIEEKVGAFQQ